MALPYPRCRERLSVQRQAPPERSAAPAAASPSIETHLGRTPRSKWSAARFRSGASSGFVPPCAIASHAGESGECGRKRGGDRLPGERRCRHPLHLTKEHRIMHTILAPRGDRDPVLAALPVSVRPSRGGPSWGGRKWPQWQRTGRLQAPTSLVGCRFHSLAEQIPPFVIVPPSRGEVIRLLGTRPFVRVAGVVMCPVAAQAHNLPTPRRSSPAVRCLP